MKIESDNDDRNSDEIIKETIETQINSPKKHVDIITQNPDFVIGTQNPWVNRQVSEDQFEKLEYKPNNFSNIIENYTKLRDILQKSSKSRPFMKLMFYFLVCFGLFIWFIICNVKKRILLLEEPNIRYFCITLIILFYLIYLMYKNRVGFTYDFTEYKLACRSWRFIKLVKMSIFIILYIFLCIYIAYIVYYSGIRNLIPVIGICVNLMFGFLISSSPHRINIRPIYSGILIQFIFAILVLQTKAGSNTFTYLSETIKNFLNHVDKGASFLFGDYSKHYFAFRILPVLAYIYCVTYMLYYFKILQGIILFVSNIMEVVMNTTAGESMSAAANIFVGMIEAPLLIKPFLGILTNSEMFAVMTGGFATIAGTVLSAFIMFGVPANHLLTASIMGAPGALAISKLVYPETKVSLTTSSDVRKIPDSTYNNVIEAITEGAIDSASLIACVALNLLVFICILSFLNYILKWIGISLCLSRTLSFESICSYIFWPIVFLIGIDYRDCFKAAELLGVKIFLNEFIAYQKLGVMISNKNIYDAVNWTITTMKQVDDDIHLLGNNGTVILYNGIMYSHRSVVITTYFLCGFGNIGSVGMLLGVLINIAPHRSKDISSIILKSLVAGNMASLLTSCIAGILYQEKK